MKKTDISKIAFNIHVPCFSFWYVYFSPLILKWEYHLTHTTILEYLKLTLLHWVYHKIHHRHINGEILQEFHICIFGLMEEY